MLRLLLLALPCVLGCERKEGPRPTPRVTYEAEEEIKPGSLKTKQLFAGTAYSAKIAKPEQLLGKQPGATPATHAEILKCFKRWAEQSPRAMVVPYAKSHEGRELLVAIISSESNINRLDQIKQRIGRLADPRGLGDAEARRIIEQTPALGWLGFNIHGNELSGADAAVAMGYHLIAGTSEEVNKLLAQVVVVIDPVMNPDGRERTITQIRETASNIPNLDYASMHRGRWPWGRGNHFLFDLNRDWVIGVAPETRGRWKMMLELHPQLVVDVHEMGALDTYLFYPASEPINPHRPPAILGWQKKFAAQHAAVFDAAGWSYYTREWVEGWYPGYSDAWASLNSAVGMLYEQAGLSGQSVRRASGRVVTYDESVRAQAISAMSDLSTLAANRRQILADYLAGRRSPLGGQKVFALRPGKHPDRERALIQTLLRQGIEVSVADRPFAAARASGVLQQDAGRQAFPAGTYLIPESQPQGLLVRALLDLDPRFPKSVLVKERHELERKKRSKIYDVTAWNLASLFDLDGYWIEAPQVPRTALAEVRSPAAGVVAPDKGQAYAWVVDGRDDRSVTFAAQAMELEVKLHIADEAFTTRGRTFPRGSLLVRRQENPAQVTRLLDQAARRAGVQVITTATGRSPDDGPDLGGHHFKLLHRPRVAVLANSPVWPSHYGHVWHQLDATIKIPFTLMDAQSLEWYDLRRYNVLIVPPSGKALGALLEPHAKKLAAWVRSGGTLIGIGSSAATLSQKKLDLGAIRARRDVLLELESFNKAAERALKSRKIEVDADLVWGDVEPPKKEKSAPGGDKKPQAQPGKTDKRAEQAAKREDEWKRLFAPHGVILRGLVDTDSWLTFGTRDELPVLLDGDHAFMVRPPAQAPVRFATADRLRLAGLLWPEARERLATTAYAAVEKLGAGQVILFAFSPCFRGYLKGTERLLANAVVYGPSLGAKPPLVW